MADVYLAIIPKSYQPAICPRSGTTCPPGVQLVYSAGRITTYCGGQTGILELPDQSGVILGRLFTREDRPKRVRFFCEQEAAAIRRNGLPHLLLHYWGGYVAILETTSGGIEVLRDPSAALSCIYTETDEAVVVGSDAAILHAAGAFHPDIDWPCLGRHFVAYDLATEATALKGVKELLPGNVLLCGPDRVRQKPLWSPWKFTTPTEKPVSADHLHHTIKSTLQAWASSFSSILVGVSGGLDSSIVAACLRETGAELTCYTMVTDQPEGDEREYARHLARHLELDLREQFYNVSDVDLNHSTTEHLARPMGHAFGQSRRKAEMAIWSEQHCNAQFNGIGGDNIFCSLQSTTPVLDRLLSEGIGDGVFQTFKDICDLTECSAIDALTMLLKRAVRFDRHYTWKPTGTFLNKDVVEAWSASLSHPWMDAPTGALPGKSVHISLLLRALSTLDSFPSQYPVTQFSPLLSQPIVELCLSVPTWQWFDAGVNRSLARRAFHSELPLKILQRRSKGGPNGFVYDVVSNNRALLRELLLDGILVRAGLLDSRQLEMALRPETPLRSPAHIFLSSLAEAETWSRYWQSRLTAPPR